MLRMEWKFQLFSFSLRLGSKFPAHFPPEDEAKNLHWSRPEVNINKTSDLERMEPIKLKVDNFLMDTFTKKTV